MASLPPFPGPGHYALHLNAPGFYLLLLLLLTFAGILFLLHRNYPGRRRAVEGFFDAAAIDMAFLLAGLALVLALVVLDPRANRTSLALYNVVIDGYWFTFSIPIVTVGTSVEDRSRGSIAWKLPSLAASGALFLGLFAYYYTIA
ncbi:MAG TPA: hypothetical protein VMH90_06490 [Thermoplasmata archaeon]|nr:hypothetical protein [Thermoplasmata archaeon]